MLVKRFSVHRVECCLVSIFECVRSNTDTFNVKSWCQFSIEVSSSICMFFLLDFVSFSIDLYTLSTWWSAYPEWVKYTLINSTCYLLIVIDVDMTRSLMQSVQLMCFRHFLFTRIPTPCLFSNFPDPMNMCPCCVSRISALLALHVSLINVVSLLYPSSF